MNINIIEGLTKRRNALAILFSISLLINVIYCWITNEYLYIYPIEYKDRTFWIIIIPTILVIVLLVSIQATLLLEREQLMKKLNKSEFKQIELLYSSTNKMSKIFIDNSDIEAKKSKDETKIVIKVLFVDDAGFTRSKTAVLDRMYVERHIKNVIE